MEALVGTEAGLYAVAEGRADSIELPGWSRIDWIAGEGDTCWIVADGEAILKRERETWELVHTMPSGVRALCALETPAGLVVGTSGAHLLLVDPEGATARRLDDFEHVEGRTHWANPGASPPDTRSLAADPAGRLYANVHVGGIVASDDGGETWVATSLDISWDVHQVIAAGDLVLAASGLRGLCMSADRGATWTTARDGLPPALEQFGVRDASYCRAVALCGETVLITASKGHITDRAGVFRRPLSSEAPFEKCRDGLPEWFDDNIDTGCLAADANVAVFGTAAGEVYASTDEGRTWQQLAEDLPRVLAVAIIS